MKTKILLAAIAAFAVSTLSAQKIILESGNIDALKNEKNITIQYDYSEFGVGKFKTEKEYVDSKVKEYNEKEKGKGDKWLTSWQGARTRVYQPKFEELINKVLGEHGYKLSENAGGKYTLIVKTTYVEPGFNVGVMNKPAYVDYDFIIVETGNPSKEVARLYTKNVPGQQAMGMDFDTSTRLSESYAKAGKILAKYIEKELSL